MMSDRTAQASAEARKYVRPQMLPVQTVSEHREEAFLDGWEAADANHPTAEALARVRELHRPVESQWGDQACAECSNGWDLEVIWPCATIKAIGEAVI